MPAVCYNNDEFFFPPVTEADEDGLLLMGGRVTPYRIIEGYKKGIFPWYNEDDIPLWWSPDPRFVLFPDELHQSKSMQKVFAKSGLEFKMNTAFPQVIAACAMVPRPGQDGTWITADMMETYTSLHYSGYAHSAEAWLNGALVGGVYGLKIGGIFFGESMFSKKSNASKFALISLVKNFAQLNIGLLDCQVYTNHVASLGGRLISRKQYLSLLNDLTS